MLPDLQIVCFFVSSVIKSFKKIFMSCFAMNYIIVYSTTIIPDVLDKVSDYMEFGVIKYWLT